ncbi:MAG TPA: septum formation initiator family protein [Candidatus Saccharimonadales bacterium]|nr:septum formation initiator family protein [Candidatus Saccharimonadales bacterium]
MLNRIKTRINRIPWQSLSDLRTIGLLIFLIIVLLVSWSGVKAIQSNYNLQKQIAVIQQQNSLQQLKNSNLNLQNGYYNTNQYLELMARQEFGLGQSGETELLVPKNVALAHLVPIISPTQSSFKANVHQSRYESNFEAWMDFFLHRQSSN